MKRSHDLTEAAYYVCFEMFHLRYYADVYERAPKDRRFRAMFGERIGQAYEYSFLIHLRVLLDFFFRPPTHSDDVWVRDFEDNPGFSAAYPNNLYTKPTGALETATQLNKRLAHFTDMRWKEKSTHWGMESYRVYWIHLLVLIDAFEIALTGLPKATFDERMKAFKSSSDHESFINVRPVS